MPSKSRLGARATSALVGLALLLRPGAPRTAQAFVLVAKSPQVTSEGMTVVALREGRDTVLSIQARVRGPAAEVALLVVVPSGPAPAPSTLKLASLDPLGRVTGPRVVEYWEQDPCEMHDIPFATDGTLDARARDAAAVPATADAGVQYATELLAGKTGAEIVASLKHDGYGVPDPLATIVDGYLKAGMQVLIARLDTGKLPRQADGAVLPPLQVHYVSDELSLPTRLFAAGIPAGADAGVRRGARRELLIDVLSPGARYEASNRPNVAVPTNLNVPDAALAAPSTFYRTLLDRTFDSSPAALVTEYAWRASTCEVCATPLSAAEIGALGEASLPSAAAGKQHEVLIDAAAVASRPDGPSELRAALMDCYGKALAGRTGLGGVVSLAVQIGKDGAIASAAPGPADEALVKCAAESVRSSKQWRADAKGTVTVTFAPVSRAFLGDLVLTALRGRYDSVPDRDLVLVPGRAIEGGREMGTEGSAPARVYPAQAGNDFQARYVVRHPFAGPVLCATPTRGVWGGPQQDAGRAGERQGVSDAGGAPDAVAIDFAAFAIHFGPPAAPSATVAPTPSAPPSSMPPPATTTPAPHADCGACSAGSRAPLPSWGWGGAVAIASLVCRRRSRRAVAAG
jgi:hypothetical protein